MTRPATTSKPGQCEAGPRDAGSADKPAWRSVAAIVVFVAVTGAALAADLWSKHAVFAWLLSGPQVAQRARMLAELPGGQDPLRVLDSLQLSHEGPGGIRLTLKTNPGVVFGLPMPPSLVLVATILTTIMVSWFFAVSPAASRWTHVALAMILAGAAGNFYDRMFAKVFVPGLDTPITGQVRDFLDFGQYHYPYVFNVADVWLVVGVVMLMLYWIAAGRGKDKGKGKESQARN